MGGEQMFYITSDQNQQSLTVLLVINTEMASTTVTMVLSNYLTFVCHGHLPL